MSTLVGFTSTYVHMQMCNSPVSVITTVTLGYHGNLYCLKAVAELESVIIIIIPQHVLCTHLVGHVEAIRS